MIWGVDVHPNFQAGLNIEQVRREGFDFMAVKTSQGRSTYPAGDFLSRGKAAGMLCLGYHYLDEGDEDAQADVFARQLSQHGVPGMLDVEAGSGDIGAVWRFVNALHARNAPLVLLYLPRWYWSQIGSPDLTGLPPLWASHYVSGSGYASSLYEGVSPDWWDGYGNNWIAVLQFTSSAQVAGYTVDADAYGGSREQFAALIGGEAPDMQLTDRWTDQDGNPQDVQTTLDRMNELWYRFLAPGSVVARDPSQTPTNLGDLITDMAAWTLSQGQQLTDMQGTVTASEAHLLAAIKNVQSGAVDVSALAEALAPLLPTQVSAEELATELGRRLAAS